MRKRGVGEKCCDPKRTMGVHLLESNPQLECMPQTNMNNRRSTVSNDDQQLVTIPLRGDPKRWVQEKGYC